MRLTVLLLLLALLSIPAGVAASDEDGEPAARLGIEALDAEGPYFEVTLEPGESAELTARFINHGEVAAGASVYAADVYTIPGGGMGIQQQDESTSGATEWLGFEPAELELQPGETVDQAFTVSVPDDTPPGDYISAIVIQNTDPIDIGDDQNQFNQTIRQGVAVNIDVPGPREPSLEIGATASTNAGDSSLIIFDLENTGNAHLRPEGEIVLEDDQGDTVAETPVSLETVYAGTGTMLEVRLAERLEPGLYQARIRLVDPRLDEEWTWEGIELEVSSPSSQPVEDESETGPEPEGAGGLVVDPDESDSGPGALVYGALALLILLSVLLATLVYLRRRSSRRLAPALPTRRGRGEPHPDGESTPAAPSTGRARPIRQLEPRKRSN